MSRSIRQSHIPSSLVLLHDGNAGVLPEEYIDECSLFSKYTKGIPNLCTNPGTCVGANTHSESSALAGHTHPNGPATSGHTHAIDTLGSNTTSSHFVLNCTYPDVNHTHTQTSGCTTFTVSTGCSSGLHTHDLQSVEPLNITIRHIKKNSTTVSMRLNHVPKDVSVYSNLPIADIPSDYSLNTNYVCNRIVKGVPDACTNPQVTGGTSNHQHSSDGNHTHTAIGSCHSHTLGSFGPALGSGKWRSNPATNPVMSGHTHTVGTAAVSCLSISGCTSSTGAHQHTGSCNLPEYHELSIVKRSSISLRNPGIPTGFIGVWACNNACVPVGFRIADGFCCTPNLLGRFIRTLPNACTNPGSQGGCANHTHTATDHNHTGSGCHAHTVTGTTGSASAGPFAASSGALGSGTHTHNLVNPSPSANVSYTTGSAGFHDHGSTSNDPASKEVAYIQKL